MKLSVRRLHAVGLSLAVLLSAGHFSIVRADEITLTKSEDIYKALPEKIRKAGVINAATAAEATKREGCRHLAGNCK